MAAITGLITVNGKEVLEVDAVPSAGGGTPAPIGSIAMYDTGTVGSVYIKTGAADTAWSQIDSNDNDWSLIGNALSGADAFTPDQQFGSTNNFDVKMIRNNTEIMRMVAEGLLIGLNASAGGRLQVEASALATDLFRQQGPNGGSGSKVVRVSRTYKVQTTNATLTTLADILTPTDSVNLITLDVVGRQHGGTAGTAGDGAAYVREIHARNIADVLSIRKNQTSFTSEDVGAFNLAISNSGANVRAQVQGALDRNIAWFGYCELMIAVN